MDLDRIYANGDVIPGAAEFPPRWQAQAAAFRASLGARARLDLPYGSGARQRFDLFLPEGTPKGLMVFVHGGWWVAFDKSTWSHLAAGAVARGWAVAMPSYTLAPEARIAAITREISAAVVAAAAEVAGPIVVTGHSAGGHLAARMACADVPLSAEVAARITRVVPISPLVELELLMPLATNTKLQIDAEEARRESPNRHIPRAGIALHVTVGAQERASFIFHARHLSEDWACDWSTIAGRHHFDVLDGLTQADDPLTRLVLGA